jgi:hypothetical protein
MTRGPDEIYDQIMPRISMGSLGKGVKLWYISNGDTAVLESGRCEMAESEIERR